MMTMKESTTKLRSHAFGGGVFESSLGAIPSIGVSTWFLFAFGGGSCGSSVVSKAGLSASNSDLDDFPMFFGSGIKKITCNSPMKRMTIAII